jgi:hypothetical protein
MVSPTAAPRSPAEVSPITRASGASSAETSRPIVAPIASGGRPVIPIGYANPAGGNWTGAAPRYSPTMPTLADRPSTIDAPAWRAAAIAWFVTSARNGPVLKMLTTSVASGAVRLAGAVPVAARSIVSGPAATTGRATTPTRSAVRPARILIRTTRVRRCAEHCVNRTR